MVFFFFMGIIIIVTVVISVVWTLCSKVVEKAFDWENKND